MRRRAVWGLAAVVAAALSAAAAQADPSVLRVAPHAPLSDVDPIWTAAYVTRNHGLMVFDTLFALDENLKPQPQMVEYWTTSEDKLGWRFTLREGLEWHDGTPVTAEDCIASLRRWGARDEVGRRMMESLAGMVALDARTFELRFAKPFGPVLEALAKLGSPAPFMMPKRLAESDPFRPVTEVIGSGPFRFVAAEWVPGERAAYVRNERYRPRREPPSGLAGGKVVKVDRVEWLRFADESEAAEALAWGRIDYLEAPSFETVKALAWTAGVRVEALDRLGLQGVVRMNHLHPPFNNVKARQALLKAISQDDHMRAAVGDPKYFATCYSVYPCGSPLASEAGAEGYKRKSIEEARRLLQEAGYKGEKVVVLHPTDIPVIDAAARVTAEALREAGVNVELQAMDWVGVAARRSMKIAPEKGGWSIFHSWSAGPEALNPLSHVGLSAACEQAWFGWPCDEGIEKLRAQFARELDPGKRAEIARQIQVRNYQEVVTQASFGVWFTPVAYRSELKGLLKAPAPLFWNVEKKGDATAGAPSPG